MKPTRLHASLVTVLVCTSSIAFAQSRFIDENCQELPDVCPLPTTDCSQPLSLFDDQDCRQCIERNPLTGTCLIRGNDPICEARKAANRAATEVDRSSRRLMCEAQNAASLRVCRKQVDAAVADCRVAKLAAAGKRADPYTTLLANGAVGNAQKIPEKARNRLVESHLYDAGAVDGLQIFQLSSTASVPAELTALPIGFTVGDHVFLKNPSDADTAPLEFWVDQLEMSRLYADYGIKELGDALTDSPATIFGLVAAKVKKNCAVLNCEAKDNPR